METIGVACDDGDRRMKMLPPVFVVRLNVLTVRNMVVNVYIIDPQRAVLQMLLYVQCVNNTMWLCCFDY